MKTYRATSTALIKAPAAQVYAIIADYHNGHPHILPKAYFSALAVEQGGVGAGTRIRFNMTVMGKTQPFLAEITEPEPGRVLVERYGSPAGVVTTFTVDPVAAGRHAQVTFATEGPARGGWLGLVEQLMTGLFLRKIYRQELALLAALAEERAGAAAGHMPTAV